jgi:tRNA-2-methylthio-N6-dimethylallyladenosine synthase
MIRRYSIAEYVERSDALRQAVPGLSLSTDVIVGFPGETRDDFEQTLALVRRMKFTGLFGFKYSPRPFTPALKLGDDVSEEEKSVRLAELFAVVEAERQAHLRALIGTLQRVLIEGRGKDGRFTGRTERNEIVHLPHTGDPTGELVEVRIVSAFKNSLAAEPVFGASRLGPRETRSLRSLPVL